MEQLEEWAERSGADIVKPVEADDKNPASVVARAADKALADGYDVLVVDTSGYVVTQDRADLCQENVLTRKYGSTSA